ncbi:MAG: hypothetical protein IT384_02990 [Deltaproteobacteria bacterium]|nr:hypothetical protein [Deltaproteobacteria bacterium]
MSTRESIALVSISSMLACGGGTGTIAVNTYGEDYIEQGIPPEIFADGWSVRFTKFLIALGPIAVADLDGDVGARLDEQRIFDLTQAGPHAIIRFPDVAAKRWENVQITHRPSRSATAGNAAAVDVTAMNQNGYSTWVEGTAQTGTIAKSFRWGFAETTALAYCEADNGSLGLVVPRGGSVGVQFTVHGDHLFYDGLQNPDAAVRFAAIAAADADGDGEVTPQELADVDLTTLPTGQYTTGGSAQINDLLRFTAALSRTFLHFQGEGECVIQ